MLALIMLGCNAVFALGFLIFHPPKRGEPVPIRLGDRIRKALGLAACGIPFGLILVGLELWITDVLWSSYYPVNASLYSISGELVSSWLLFVFVFAITAFHVAPWIPDDEGISPARVLHLLFWTFLAYLMVHQTFFLLVVVPSWQTSIREIFPAWVRGSRELACHAVAYLGIPFIMGAMIRSPRRLPGLRASTAALSAVLLSLLAVAQTGGMPIHYALLLGQRAEKIGLPENAIPWYSRALTWSQSEKLKSYLQFRVGLLYRKTGRLEDARDAFVRVLVRYPNDPELLADADDFKERLKAGAKTPGRRVVIPGMEARTEYKSAYCVPNSLGLVLNFFGDRSGAKRIGSEITQLDRGSLITDEVYFAESRGLRSFIAPLSTRQQMQRLIEAGIPVLAFIPGHVIAVFGYDDVLGTIVTYDVSTFDIWDDQRWQKFESDWSQTYNTMGVVAPDSLVPRIRAILGEGMEARSEAYLNYLMAAQFGTESSVRASRLKRAASGNFFPAGWDYHGLTGETGMGPHQDSLAGEFILSHETGDETATVFAGDLLARGLAREAVEFLTKVRETSGSKSSSLLNTVMAAAQLKRGKPEEAEELLFADPAGVNALETAPALFLLSRGNPENDADWMEGLGADLLGRDGLRGEEAALAYRAWRSATSADVNPDADLELTRNYLERWHPYDSGAIADLAATLETKVFRTSEELLERMWKKRMRLYAARQKRLGWARKALR